MMVGATLKRVVVDNYKIFNHKQVLDFRRVPALSINSKYFTLVGENGSGKSTFLALVGLASDFGGKVTSHVCNPEHGSIVACEYEIESWSGLSSTQGSIKLNYPALELWFLTGILKIPFELQQYISERYLGGLNKRDLTIVIGFKHSPSLTGEVVVSKFLYVQSGSSVIALVHKLTDEAKVAVVDSMEIEELIDWVPSESALTSTGCNFLLNLKTPTDISRECLNPENPQASLILALRNMLAPESRDTIWADVIELFHELTGNTKITVIFDSLNGCVRMRQQHGDCETIRDDLPEGFFHAFIVAFLVVNPLVKTILLDEPTRGMHPLQIRRLQRILSQKSLQEDKVIVVATHAPDMLHTSQINHIFRFQQLNSGFVEVRRTSIKHDNRDIRFISSVEGRELFFTRRIIWVEGDTDRRFCEAMLKLIDEGNELLWSLLMDPQDIGEGHPRTHAGSTSTVEDMDDGSDSSEEIDYGDIGINPLDNLFQTPAYERSYFRAEVLGDCQELARSCSVLPLSGKKNIDKATRTCKDLGIPYAVICDLDAVLPNSKKNSIMSQFMKCVGNWNLASVEKKLLFDAEQSPASTCIEDPTLKAQLRKCHTANEVMEFYESMERIFAWKVGNGEIEDLVKVTKRTFSKKWWADFTSESFQDLIQFMLAPNVEGATGYGSQANPELLRCFYFVLDFLQAVNGSCDVVVADVKKGERKSIVL